MKYTIKLEAEYDGEIMDQEIVNALTQLIIRGKLTLWDRKSSVDEQQMVDIRFDKVRVVRCACEREKK